MKSTSWSAGLSVTGDGTGVVAHAGSVAVRMLADRIGLTDALSAALARRGFTPGHDRGRVLVDVATMIAAGGEAIADIDTLRHQRQVLGPVASPPTVWRALDELTPAALRRIEHGARQDAGPGVEPDPRRPARLDGGRHRPCGDVVVLDVDATIVIAHSEKEQAAATFKKTFGYHPIGVWCDNTSELLAASLRPGNAGSNTTADHIDVLTAAIAQVPAGHRRKLLVRADGAGASHGLLDWLTGLNTAGVHGRRGRSVEYSRRVRAHRDRPRRDRPGPEAGVDAGGRRRRRGPRARRRRRDHRPAHDLTRRGRPGCGSSSAANTPTPARSCPCSKKPGRVALPSLRHQHRHSGRSGFLEARHRAHARVEDRIRVAKDTGLCRFPSREYAINQAWLALVAIAADLTAWLRLLALPPALASCEPKALRYRFLHIPARLTRGARRRHLRLPATWPWVKDAVATFSNVLAIPMLT